MCARYSAAKAACDIMLHLVNEPEHGYAQDNRNGSDGWCEIESQGFTFTTRSGDRDCSSGVSGSWKLALSVTPYAGALDNAYWTGNIFEVFKDSGLFVPWYTYETIAEPGDVYLKHDYATGLGHTAMCISTEPDTLAEFLINENNDIVNGQTGDQTGWESIHRDFYDPGWIYTFHYNGMADFEINVDYWSLQLFKSNGSDAQKFKMEWSPSGYMFVNVADGRAIDAYNAATNDGTEICLYTPHGMLNQRWNLVSKGNGACEIVSSLDSSMCIDAIEGTNKLCLWKRHGGKNQEWHILENGDGTVTIVNNGKLKLVMDCVDFGGKR